MGPIEQEMVNGYSALSVRLKALAPIPKPANDIALLQGKISSLTIELQSLKLKLWEQETSSKTKIDYLIHRCEVQEDQIRLLKSVNKVVSLNKILTLVSRKERISQNDLYSPRRQQDVVFARQIAYYLCCVFTRLGTPTIGKAIGDRDHTTVIHGRDKIKNLRVTDPVLNNKLKWYEEQLRGKAV